MYNWYNNSKIDLKDNFVSNWKNSNARRFLNSYALKGHPQIKAGGLKNNLGAKFVQKFRPPRKTASLSFRKFICIRLFVFLFTWCCRCLFRLLWIRMKQLKPIMVSDFTRPEFERHSRHMKLDQQGVGPIQILMTKIRIDAVFF